MEENKLKYPEAPNQTRPDGAEVEQPPIKEEEIKNNGIKEEIKKNLLKLPGSIKKREIELLDILQKQDERVLQIKNMSKKIELDIEGETDKEGKKKYKNAIEREIEKNRRLGFNKEFIETSSMANKTKRKIEEDKIEIDFLKKKFRSYESLTRMGE